MRKRIHCSRFIPVVVGGAADLAHTIVSITNDGNDKCLVTTAAPHNMPGEVPIIIQGTDVESYNQGHTVVEAPTLTTFATDISYDVDATGGTWELA